MPAAYYRTALNWVQFQLFSGASVCPWWMPETDIRTGWQKGRAKGEFAE